MADGNYDNTNSGIIFQPHQDQELSGQGKLNIEGREVRIIMVYEKLGRDKPPVQVLYQRLGPLFPNDKKGNDKAPDLSGPLDDFPNHRLAAWRGEKDGRKYMSLKASLKQNASDQSGGGQQQSQQQGGYGYGQNLDDEIPF